MAAAGAGLIERAQAMVAVGMRPQDQAQRRDVIPDDMKQQSGLGTVAGAGSAVRRPGCSTTTSFRSNGGGSSNQENLQVRAGHVTAARVPA